MYGHYITKRILDIILILIAMPLWLSCFSVVYVVSMLMIGRPVFFVQLRPGLGGKPFRICKFRTMRDMFDEEGKPLPDEQRLTSLGHVLRSASLDELPELWNVIRGEMSLVGPRPLLMEYLQLYSPEQRRRLDVPPGITGWAQVNGRNSITWEEKFALDLWYIENRCLWLDIKILLLTLLQVICRRGIAHPGTMTMPKFEGKSSSN